MQTHFAPQQLDNPDVAHSAGIIRKCVHCGFCTATCPTYVTLGNELDSPRGRIYLIKEMLENDRPADAETVTHIDRCLSCNSCITTCPADVNYMHLVDHARNHIEATYRRPPIDRLTRQILALTLPYPQRFRASLTLARLARPLAGLLDRIKPLKPMAAMLRLAPAHVPAPSAINEPGTRKAAGTARARVAILTGCAQSVLDPRINEATVSLLNRVGVDVVVARGETCCGALVHHMGREHEAHAFAKKNIDAWTGEVEREGLDAIIITASGCGTTVKDYAHMLRLDPDYAEKAAAISNMTRDITEFLATLDLPAPVNATGLDVAYHSACSMQHGQRVQKQPRKLLADAGFIVHEVPEGHLCCGSAGTYNITQPEIAGKLKDRKVRNIESVKPQAIATGNIGCITQIASGTAIPILHTIELLDWAHGGEKPALLSGLEPRRESRPIAAE
ncbi:glycolate oxidase subunit GlcF [Fulvimarina sp. 2208YS6-2-32]|uniref:Glycolate oxidase iron-sulfur subunit n=1 Tax=Fulvimarina uroteuthidis TaxID=3098149 RepID=A0ABU5I0E8_9HYPH|nr:glycolate oxidase subunit GlcF [Fulvimarina sp. 2208YS6-2-32]MDY8108597.1 glycolate oxidase subunit GlcF [Fulvimarina sp. 2208YS6-2-32]